MTERSSQIRVLIAGDKMAADTLAVILNLAGFYAEAAHSGEQALGLAPSVHPDLFISDVIMGEMTGVEAALSIRQILPDCKVILCSGLLIGEELVRRAAENGHSFELLPKPVFPEPLISRIRGLYPGDPRLPAGRAQT